MEEISRSDAIKVMNTWKFICSLGDNVEPRAIGVTRFEMIDTCTKAISDMQKIEKIEHILFDIGECEELTDDIGSKYEKYCEPNLGDCNKCMIARISKILKGEEDEKRTSL